MGTGRWKASRTGSLERLPYIIVGAHLAKRVSWVLKCVNLKTAVEWPRKRAKTNNNKVLRLHPAGE
jgi:hypothetical protein